MFTNRSATKIAEMCFLVPKMNSDSLGASQLANMKQVAACNIQISRGALNRLDRSRCLSASMITTVPQFGWKNKSPLIEHKTSRIPKSLRSLSLFPPTIWCLERRNISTCAAKLAGRILKKKKLPATDGADQLLAGNRYLFPTMMIDCFNLPTRGCSAPEPATDGNNAPLPLKSPCAAPVAPSCPCLTNNPHYEGYMMSQRERAREISMHQATFSWYPERLEV